MDPPGTHASTLKKPQPFEIALVRKLEQKTKSIHDAFLLLDVDGDGKISPSDIRTVLHNEFEIDVTKEQEEYIFSHPSLHIDGKGMRYADFAEYFSEVSNAPYTTSEFGFAASVGFQKDKDANSVENEAPIQLQPETVRMNLRHQLRQILTSHSSRSTAKTGSAMKETSLFLTIDVHQSGKVTMQEFLDWLNEVGNCEWAIDDLKLVVLGTSVAAKDDKGWFSSNESNMIEAGMTEYEFATFVESLDMDMDSDDCSEAALSQ